MKRHIILFSIGISLLFGACTSDYELDRPVFIDDEIYPGLPAYTEWGYNSFGVYIDRRPFTSSNWDLPVKVIAKDRTLQFQLRGNMSYYSMNSYSWNALTFFIKGLSMEDYKDLLYLHEQTFDLTSDNCQVTLERDGMTYELPILSGALNFKRAQHLYIDKQSQQVILSGTFNFKTIIEEEPITASEGRFDLGIGDDNFYFYPRN